MVRKSLLGVRSPNYAEMLDTVSKNTRSLRQRRGLKQRELASQIGRSQTRISRLEKNHVTKSRVYKIPLDMVCDIAFALGVPTHMLFMPGAFGDPTEDRIR